MIWRLPLEPRPVHEKRNNVGLRPGPTQTSHRKMVRGWKFWILKVEELYYPCSENQGADQLRSYCEADRAFVFAFVDCWFSHALAH